VRPGAGPGSATDQGQGQNREKPDAPKPGTTQWLGLGGKPGPGQVNLNLTQQGVVAVVGADELRKEREADGERRRSEHRGSWTASNFERWRSAIENYVSSVKNGNQTALNTAAVPFASYLNGMHNRIHPIFADNFLGSLDALPKNHPMNDPKVFTRLEIVVTKDGHLVKMGIIKTSGITAFDIAALDSVNRAQPFGPAPGAIVSPDGNVYLHWEFHRDEVYACSTMNARPFLLANPPKQNEPPPPAPGKPPSPSQERGVPPMNTHETREGALDIVRASLGG
jgi:TonB family protein